ncbi:hypothetical protein [Enhygromyxa salina]|nr:hypothetical protein [Enhygromyxa salina]
MNIGIELQGQVLAQDDQPLSGKRLNTEAVGIWLVVGDLGDIRDA